MSGNPRRRAFSNLAVEVTDALVNDSNKQWFTQLDMAEFWEALEEEKEFGENTFYV